MEFDIDNFALYLIVLTVLVLAIIFPVNLVIESYEVSWDFWYFDDTLNIFSEFITYTYTIFKYLFTVAYYILSESPSVFKIPLLAVFALGIWYAISLIAKRFKDSILSV